MNIHEYQAKSILSSYGIKIPEGYLAQNTEEAVECARKIGNDSVVVLKAQVHAGGRGKAGGIKLVKNVDDVKGIAQEMFGMKLVTPQTGDQGKIVHKLYVEKGSDIAREFYFSLVLDRNSKSISIIASQDGGMEIEEVAKRNPERIITLSIDPTIGLCGFHVRRLFFALKISKEQQKSFAHFVQSAYKVFIEKDASQIEINPLVLTKQGDFIPLDAKFNIDDNSLFRQKEVASMRDEMEEEALEVRATKSDLSYIKMDGSIGCMVNGAGLAMATMDIIQLHGAAPANFLDVGGGATAEKVSEAFRIITEDKNVKVILINIFGGIMRCDIIADGVINAAKEVGLKLPVVVRLAGTNSEIGKEMLKKSGLNLQAADDMEDAAKKAVALVG